MIRFGILGAGRILEKYGPALAGHASARLVAIASRDLERARAAAKRFGATRAHAGYEALVADPDVDVVVNALHNGLHCEWTVRALEAGKHVLCEKPLACSSEEVERMFAAAHRAGRWLMEAFMYRFHPQIAEAKRRVDAGQIGRLVRVDSAFAGKGRGRDNPRYWKQAGGGALMDLGCYCVNFSRLFAGEPRRASARALFDGVDLAMEGTLSGEVEARFFCSMIEETLRIGASVTGTDGVLEIPHPWLPPTSPATLIVTRGAQREQIVVPAPPMPAAPFALEIEHFCACVREGRAPQFPPGVDAEADSRANMRAIELLLDAARLNP